MSTLKYNRLVTIQTVTQQLFNKNTLSANDMEHKDAVVVTDMDGNSIIGTVREAETTAKEERNIFTEVLKERHNEKEKHGQSIDIYLQQKCKSLQDKLESATNFYAMKHYAKAVELYAGVLATIKTDSYPDEFRLEKDAVFQIKYALALSNMAVNKCGALITACELLDSLIPVHGKQVPALYYSLAVVNFMLNYYEKSEQALGQGLERLAECADSREVTFPASNDIIPDTDRLTLKDKMLALRKDCKSPAMPDAKCFYPHCVSESKSIYFNSPRFLGYASVRCSEDCKFNYHRSCWKIKLKVDNVKNPAVYLSQCCETSDCTGTVSVVNIFDESLNIVKHIAPKEDTLRTHRTKTEKNTSVLGHQNKRNRSSSRTKQQGEVDDAQLKMPPQVVHESNLKPEAVEFRPKSVKCDVATGTSILPPESTAKTEDKFNAGLSNDTPNIHQDAFHVNKVNQSNFKVDASEFRPQHVVLEDNNISRSVNVVDWSTNSEYAVEVDDTQLKMPPEVVHESSLKPEAVEFNPKSVKCDVATRALTLPPASAVKTDDKFNPGLSNDTPNIHQDVFQINKVNQSNFKVDASEFRPQHVVLEDNNINRSVNVVDWSTNSEYAVHGLNETVGSSTLTHPVDLSTTAFVQPTHWSFMPHHQKHLHAGGSGRKPRLSSSTVTIRPQTIDKCVATDQVRVNCVASQVFADSTERGSQTESNGAASVVKANVVKCEMKGLKSLLVSVEDAYNNLLFEHKQLLRRNQVNSVPTCNVSSQTERLGNYVNAVRDASTDTTCIADSVQKENERLTDEVQKLQMLLELQREWVRECQMQYRQEISSLEHSNHDLEQKLAAAQNELGEYKQNHAGADPTRLLKEEICRCKNFYGSYLNMYMDKCKHMIWTLDAVKPVTTADSTPSDSQIAENLRQWNTAFLDAINHDKLISTYYESIRENIACESYTKIVQFPALHVLAEPPNIILRDFQFVVKLNRKLEHDMGHLMQGLMLVPPPVTAPPAAWLQSMRYNVQSASAALEPAAVCSTGKPSENWSDMWDSMNSAVAADKLHTAAANDPGFVHSLDTPPGLPVKSSKAHMSLGAIPRGNAETLATGPSKSAVELPKKSKANVAGISALIHKIQDQFPLTSSEVIREAVLSMREQHGGLTGMSSKQIMAEVRKYVHAKQRSVTPVQSAWSKVNVPVQWQSEQQDRTCAICLDAMSPTNSVEMSCQHKFHTQCIKLWLQSDSVCPICRSYITLTDEYPPLM